MIINKTNTAHAHRVGMHTHFNLAHTLHNLKHYLPSQTPLKDFIHHNSLHAFQQQRFYDALRQASAVFGFQVTLQLGEYRQLYANGRIREEILDRVITETVGSENLLHWKDNLLFRHYDACIEPRTGQLRANWKKNYGVDLDTQVQPLLFRILCSYLDQGIALWTFPQHPDGFLAAFTELEKNGLVSFFKTTRARNLLLSGDCSLEKLLGMVVGRETYFENYIYDQQFAHRGWSGMVAVLEERPDSLLDQRKITLLELITLELLLEIDALDAELGKGWAPLSATLTEPPADLFAEVSETELHTVFKLWQDAFEWSYYDQVLAGIANPVPLKNGQETKRSFQAVFCIDERECSLRRHVEFTDPACETLGSPGFFGVEFYFQPEGGKFYEKLCPAPVTPKYLVKESNVTEKRKHELLYIKQSHAALPGFFVSLGLGFVAAGQLLLNLFRPKMSPAISDAFSHMGHNSKLTIVNRHPEDIENGLQIGFTITEMTVRVKGLLRSIGLVNNFAPLVYVVAHGSSSANNPHHGAHDCGACSGRPGATNARVFAAMANHPEVRKALAQEGIVIPESTVFVGAMHDTASDLIRFYDDEQLPASLPEAHAKNKRVFETALNLNAKERSRRFASIATAQPVTKVRKAIEKRSVSLFEPRPELGHGTNTLCIVGSRNLTRNMFLDRRAFLNSYDYKTDLNGELLTGVMKPLGPVCGGINLEYYFSRVDNFKLGAGTKLPHNVMGLFGVANSCDGDLRPGLPVQMIEVHDPVRLLIIVEHFPEVVLKTIQSVPEMYEWFINEWVHLAAVNPETQQVYYFSRGAFNLYKPLTGKLPALDNPEKLFEAAREMESAAIADATRENLPVYTLIR